MRGGLAIPAAFVLAIVLLAGSVKADVPDPGIPRYANNIFSGFVTPTVRPGQTVAFSFNVTNPYDDPGAVMTDVNVTVGIYKYSTQHETRIVDAEFSNPPLFDGLATQTHTVYGELQTDQTFRVNLSIETRSKTPHGSVFDQSTYFVRLKLDFRFIGNSTHVLMQSRGWFTDEQWDTMVSFETGEPLLNRTYMESLGVDGLIPDSSFGIKQKIPLWPLGGLIVGICAVSFMALFSFVMDNPGRFPGLEKRFYYLRGKLRESWDELKDRGRK